MEGLTKADRIWLRLMKIGHGAGCHQMASRSFFFRGYQLPLCARCTGIAAGHVLGTALFFCGIRISWGLLCLMWLPCAADGLLQRYTSYLSNNRRRLVTGILVGTAYIQMLLLLSELLFNLISVYPG